MSDNATMKNTTIHDMTTGSPGPSHHAVYDNHVFGRYFSSFTTLLIQS